MFEELDDIAYREHNYRDKINSDDAPLDTGFQTRIDQTVELTLKEATPSERSAFELFWLHKMTEQKIAKALDLEPGQVEEVLKKVLDQTIKNLQSKLS